MSTLAFSLVTFAWTLIAFSMGGIVHWWATRKQHRLLQMYRIRERERQRWKSLLNS